MSQPISKSTPLVVRYAFVGGFNAVFSYSTFALFNWSFRGWGSYSYMYAAVLANFLAISAAFLGYKWFVFRTRGNYLREWLRCFAVYGGSSLLGLAGLPILVWIFRSILQRKEFASYIAAAIMMGVGILSSYIGHKNFSFRPKPKVD